MCKPSKKLKGGMSKSPRGLSTGPNRMNQRPVSYGKYKTYKTYVAYKPIKPMIKGKTKLKNPGKNEVAFTEKNEFKSDWNTQAIFNKRC